MKYLLMVLTILFFSLPSFALTLSEALSLYKPTQDVPNLESSVSFIGDVEVRAGVDRDQGTRTFQNDLQVRFSLNGYDEQTNKEKLYENQQARLTEARKEFLNNELALVYKLYLKLHFGIIEKQKLKKLMTISEDRVRVTNILLKKNKALITDLVSIEQNINEVRNRLIIKETELKKNLELFNRLLGKNFRLKDISLNERFVSVKKIENSINQTPRNAAQIDLNLQKANLEYSLQNSEDSKILRFIQLGVQRTNGIDEVGISVALNLPFMRDKQRMNEKLINKMRAEYESRIASKAFVAEIDEIKLQILSSIESLDRLTRGSYLTKAKKYLSVYSRSKGIAPQKLLQLNNTLLTGQIEKINLQHNIFNLYVSYLKEKGVLSQFPTSNVLSNIFKGDLNV